MLTHNESNKHAKISKKSITILYPYSTQATNHPNRHELIF